MAALSRREVVLEPIESATQMRGSSPPVLTRLLAATGADAHERAWAAFAGEYSALLLHVARRLGGDHDAVMDRYAFILEALHRDGFRRLRGYASDGRGKFTTWLMVVARRLCLDEYRRRYGRPQGEGATSVDQWAERRRLLNLVGEALDANELAGSPDQIPDVALQQSELRTMLEAAITQLDSSDRLLLRLRFVDDLPVPQIARLLGEGSPFHYYRRLDRVLAGLRQSLSAVGVEDAAP
jgi:RNA polymerase sigma factor (sigma-70 family)